MADGEKGTTPKTSATVPKGPSPFRSETKTKKEARLKAEKAAKLKIEAGATDPKPQEVDKKVQFLDLCTDKCVAAIQQYRISRTEEVMKKIDWTYGKVLDTKAEIKAILDEVHNLNPEDQAAYLRQGQSCQGQIRQGQSRRNQSCQG